MSTPPDFAALVAAARADLNRQREEDRLAYEEIDRVLTSFAELVAAGKMADAAKAAERACDLEYALMCNCDFCGPLSDAFPENNPENRP